MADERYIVPENPEYNSEIRKIQDSDPVKASTIVNPVLSQMIENMHATHLSAEKAGDLAGKAIPKSEKGKPQGIAELDAGGKVPMGQLPTMDYDAAGSAAAVQTALDAHAADKGNPHKVTKAQVGLENADNTSDADKPISTATQRALDLKANLASPALTGTPTAPTAPVGTNTAQIATTAFVQENAGSDYSFVYQCTGTADSTAIADIVNDFFNNGIAMTMKLIITGTMGVAFTENNYAMHINGENERGGVCYLDFSDCNIPEITEDSKRFLYVTGNTNLDITGLVVKTTYEGIRASNSSGNNSFRNCFIESTKGNFTHSGVAIYRGKNNTFSNCVINGTNEAVYLIEAENNMFSQCKINNTGVHAVRSDYLNQNNAFVQCEINNVGSYAVHDTDLNYETGGMYVLLLDSCILSNSSDTTSTCVSFSGMNAIVSNCAVHTYSKNGSAYGFSNSNGTMSISNTYIYSASNSAPSAGISASHGRVSVSNSLIESSHFGVSCTYSSSDAFFSISNCIFKTSDLSIRQTAAGNTASWNIVGNFFSSSTISVNGATQTAATATANAYLYMPAYANQFNQTIT